MLHLLLDFSSLHFTWQAHFLCQPCSLTWYAHASATDLVWHARSHAIHQIWHAHCDTMPPIRPDNPIQVPPIWPDMPITMLPLTCGIPKPVPYSLLKRAIQDFGEDPSEYGYQHPAGGALEALNRDVPLERVRKQFYKLHGQLGRKICG